MAELPTEVPYSMLAWEKMEGKLPAIVVARSGMKRWPRSLAHYSPEEVFSFLEGSKRFEGQEIWPIYVDCDGDALFFEYETEGMPKDKTRFTDRLRTYRDVDLACRGTSELIPTVIATPTGQPLGLAYSNTLSLNENLKPKTVLDGHKVHPPRRYLTLWSRKHGMWPKGLKAKETNPDGSLPPMLGMSSGNYLEAKDIWFAPSSKSLMIVANVPRGHGFCHEEYYNPTAKEMRAYKSCFNRWIQQLPPPEGEEFVEGDD